MIYIRGHANDYDEWAQLGLPGWSYQNVLPYFKKSEGFEGGESKIHGADGPLTVTERRYGNPLMADFIAAGADAGYPVTDDFNGDQQEGFGWYNYTIANHQRCSSAAAYLEPGRKRANLATLTDAHVSRIIIEDGRATGVEYIRGRAGGSERVLANCEVLICAGTIQSPHILQLSGIGNADDLHAAGIDIKHHLAGVGANLQDYLDIKPAWNCSPELSLYRQASGMRKIAVGLNYIFRKRGVGCYNPIEPCKCWLRAYCF